MAEEFRFFLRTGLYILIAGVVYWFVSYEASGTVLLGALVLAIVAFIAVGLALAGPRREAATDGASGVLGTVDRVIGFHERAEATPPLEGRSELIPLASPWPVVTAAAIILVGLGLIFGAWLIVPGLVVLVIGGLGWLTQLDQA